MIRGGPNVNVVKDDLLIYIDPALRDGWDRVQNSKLFNLTGDSANDFFVVGTCEIYGDPYRIKGPPNIGDNLYYRNAVTPTELQGSPSYTVVAALNATASFNARGSWGFGTNSTADGISNYMGTATLGIGTDLWGTNTYAVNGETYPLNDWVIVHWRKVGGEYFIRDYIDITVNDTNYTGTGLNVLRESNPTINPTVGTEGMAISGISYDTGSYHAPLDTGMIGFYNRRLTDAEVQTNFNRLRKRYGI